MGSISGKPYKFTNSNIVDFFSVSWVLFLFYKLVDLLGFSHMEMGPIYL